MHIHIEFEASRKHAHPYAYVGSYCRSEWNTERNIYICICLYMWNHTAKPGQNTETKTCTQIYVYICGITLQNLDRTMKETNTYAYIYVCGITLQILEKTLKGRHVHVHMFIYVESHCEIWTDH